MIYAAMFDEVDEGTALFPAVARPDGLPQGARMVSLDQEGCSVTDDWYLRITGKAAGYLHECKAPPKSLPKALNQ